MPLVEARDVTRVWGKGNAATVGVSGVDLDIRHGELVAVVGPSGSGKSTLGALIAGIDTPTSGSLVVNGMRIDRMKTDQLACVARRQRRHRVPGLPSAADADRAGERGAGDRARAGRVPRVGSVVVPSPQHSTRSVSAVTPASCPLR